MKTPFGRMIFPRKALFSICEEMRRMKPDASAPLPFRQAFDRCGMQKKIRIIIKNPTMNLVSDNEQRNNRLRLRKP